MVDRQVEFLDVEAPGGGHLVQGGQGVQGGELRHLHVPHAGDIRGNAAGRRQERLAVDPADRRELHVDAPVPTDRLVELIDDLLDLLAFPAGPLLPIGDHDPAGGRLGPRARTEQQQRPCARHQDPQQEHLDESAHRNLSVGRGHAPPVAAPGERMAVRFRKLPGTNALRITPKGGRVESEGRGRDLALRPCAPHPFSVGSRQLPARP